MSRSRSLAAVVMGAALFTATSACTTASDPDTVTAAPASSSPGETGSDPNDAVLVRTGNLTTELRLEGTVQRSTGIALTPGPSYALTDTERLADVTKGDRLGRLVVAPATVEALGTSASDIDVARLAQLRRSEGDVLAPSDGRLVLDPVPRLEVGGTDVVTPLTPMQRLRLDSDSFTARASVETIMGSRTVDCIAVWIEDGLAGSPDAGDDSGPAPAGEVHCRLPVHIETAPGLRATFALTGTTITAATLVPNLFIGYDTDADRYTVRIDDGSGPRTVPVTVGLTDGVIRVVETDLPDGAVLLMPETATGG